MKKLTLTCLAIVLLISACDVTGLNDNEKDPTDVSAEPLFSRAQVALGTFLVDGPKYMPQYWTTTSYATTTQYEINEFDIPDNMWNTLYTDVLVNLKRSKQKIQDNDLLGAGEKKNKLASIEVMYVLTYYKLVNIFGDLPYSEALDPDNTQPVYDDDKAIYSDMMKRLNGALKDFDASAPGFGSADIIYGGDVSQWIKFTNSLKMRLGITVADVNSSMAKTAIEAASPNAFTSNDDNAMIPFQPTPPGTNPIWEGLVQSGRHDNLPAEPLVNRMNDRNDPRRAVLFTTINGGYSGGVYGQTNDYGAYSHFSDLVKKKDRPGMILGYDEVEFIRAEAAARGYNVNGSAEMHYNNGIRADMEYLGISQSDINAYMAQQNVAYSTASGTAQEKIGMQKWFALFLQGLQGWTEVRRLDTPDLQAPQGAASDGYPTRFTYPLDEQAFNQTNYSKAASAIGGDELTTQLFWDVN